MCNNNIGGGRLGKKELRSAGKLLLLAGVALAALALTSCDLLGGVSIQQRVERFRDDINAHNWDNLHTHLHPSHPARNQLRAAAAWNPAPFADTVSVNFNNISVSGSSATVRVSGTAAVSGTWQFGMLVDEPNVWYITTLTRGGASLIPNFAPIELVE